MSSKSTNKKVYHTANLSSCVAITGLGGHAFGSFKEKDGSHMWLCDDLPQHLSSTRIMTYGYDSRLQNSLSFQDIKSLGTEFMTTITSIRPRVPSTSVGDLDVSFPSKGTISQESRKPLFFIAHSMGGVIVKEVNQKIPTQDSQC